MKSPRFYIGQLKAVRSRAADAAGERRNVHYDISNTLNALRQAICDAFPGDIARSVEAFTNAVDSSKGHPPYPASGESVVLLCDQLLDILQQNPPSSQGAVIARFTPESRTVFVVHGHDEANLLRLRALLKERFGLKPVILMEEPSSGQTVIEKFERAATEAAFCLVLMTPDDQVKSRQGEITQARPNVIFELGWFYGRLGRSRVCILSKRGTAIHSDLAGIVRIEFIESVDEAVPGIERELRQAGLVT